jgi:hypothetical protein
VFCLFKIAPKCHDLGLCQCVYCSRAEGKIDWLQRWWDMNSPRERSNDKSSEGTSEKA